MIHRVADSCMKVVNGLAVRQESCTTNPSNSRLDSRTSENGCHRRPSEKEEL